jgi:hypothetical protein
VWVAAVALGCADDQPDRAGSGGAGGEATATTGTPHDVIIILGCPNEDNGAPAACQTARVDIAMSLYQAGLASAFITTGGAVQNQWIEAETLRDLLVAEGITSRRRSSSCASTWRRASRAKTLPAVTALERRASARGTD